MEIQEQTQFNAEYQVEEIPIVFFNAQINGQGQNSINILISDLNLYSQHREDVMNELKRFEEKVFNEIN